MLGLKVQTAVHLALLNFRIILSKVSAFQAVISESFFCLLAVILSNYYDLPFNDILDWKKFAVILKEKDVYELKQILKAITDEEFVTLHNNLVKVQSSCSSVDLIFVYSLLCYLLDFKKFAPSSTLTYCAYPKRTVNCEIKNCFMVVYHA